MKLWGKGKLVVALISIVLLLHDRSNFVTRDYNAVFADPKNLPVYQHAYVSSRSLCYCSVFSRLGLSSSSSSSLTSPALPWSRNQNQDQQQDQKQERKQDQNQAQKPNQNAQTKCKFNQKTKQKPQMNNSNHEKHQKFQTCEKQHRIHCIGAGIILLMLYTCRSIVPVRSNTATVTHTTTAVTTAARLLY